MESPRETKRRKVDTSTQNIPAVAPTPRKRPTPKANGTPASRAKQAREGLPPYYHSKENAQPPNGDTIHVSGADPHSALGKLKTKTQAQESGRNEAPSPARKAPETPSKMNGMAGFFKKFADPRLASMRAKEKETSEEEAADEDSDSGSHASSIRASERRKQLSTKLREQSQTKQPVSIPASAAKKKMFEDEIRDLEQAGRDQAGAEDAGRTTPAAQPNGRRAGSRSQTPIQGTTNRTTPAQRKTPNVRKTPVERATPVAAQATSEKKPRGRPRKVIESENITDVEQSMPQILIDGDAMEVDDSEEERLTAAKKTPPPATKRKIPFTVTSQKSATHKPHEDVTEPTDLPSLNTTQIEALQRMTLEKIHGKRPVPLTNLSDEYAKVNTVIGQTITAGESNSMLLIGGRGSGKTALVNHILQEQAKEHPDDFHAVRLNGFVHTDDKIALREIWRQLGREMELDEEENTARNYADTLASLLALLSHPLELGQEQAPGQSNKSVIFVLDEFELFASHPRQTLLYNLFDIAQSRKAPIAVLGLTTRIDVAESLEKRVKSRFSHRYVHLSSPKNLPAFIDVCKATLFIKEDSLHDDERGVLNISARQNDRGTAGSSTLDAWNAAMEEVLSSNVVTALLHRTYYTTKSASDLLAALLIPIASLPSKATTSTAIKDHIISGFGPRLMPPDSKLTLLAGLSTLQLALLICAARQTAIHATETVSFNLAYEEYKLLASKAKIQAAASGAMGSAGRLWSKEVAKDAWMDLIDMGMMIEDGYSGRGGIGAAGRADVSLEEIGHAGVDLGSWARWCKEI